MRYQLKKKNNEKKTASVNVCSANRSLKSRVIKLAIFEPETCNDNQ